MLVQMCYSLMILVFTKKWSKNATSYLVVNLSSNQICIQMKPAQKTYSSKTIWLKHLDVFGNRKGRDCIAFKKLEFVAQGASLYVLSLRFQVAIKSLFICLVSQQHSFLSKSDLAKVIHASVESKKGYVVLLLKSF